VIRQSSQKHTSVDGSANSGIAPYIAANSFFRIPDSNPFDTQPRTYASANPARPNSQQNVGRQPSLSETANAIIPECSHSHCRADAHPQRTMLACEIKSARRNRTSSSSCNLPCSTHQNRHRNRNYKLTASAYERPHCIAIQRHSRQRTSHSNASACLSRVRLIFACESITPGRRQQHRKKSITYPV